MRELEASDEVDTMITISFLNNQVKKTIKKLNVTKKLFKKNNYMTKVLV